MYNYFRYNKDMVYNNGFGVRVITDTEQDKLKRGEYNYIALRNNTEYKLQLTNDRATDAMAEVFIEDEKVGTWFIAAHNNITIDRPANISRRFTFFRETDARAISAGVTPGESTNGLIRVVFYPKKQQYFTIQTSPNIMLPALGASPRSPRSPSSPRPWSFQQSMSQMPMIPSVSGQSDTFSPRTLARPIMQSSNENVSRRSLVPTYNQYQSGATVLGRESNQTFGTMRRFSDDDIDWANKTEIIIRLIVNNNVFISTVQSSSPNHWNREFVAIRDSTQPIHPHSIPPRIDYTPLF